MQIDKKEMSESEIRTKYITPALMLDGIFRHRSGRMST